MLLFIIQLLLSFGIIIIAAVLIVSAKARQQKSSPPLTGMCHKTGDHVCAGCAEKAKLK